MMTRVDRVLRSCRTVLLRVMRAGTRSRRDEWATGDARMCMCVDPKLSSAVHTAFFLFSILGVLEGTIPLRQQVASCDHIRSLFSRKTPTFLCIHIHPHITLFTFETYSTVSQSSAEVDSRNYDSQIYLLFVEHW